MTRVENNGVTPSGGREFVVCGLPWAKYESIKECSKRCAVSRREPASIKLMLGNQTWQRVLTGEVRCSGQHKSR